MKLTLIEQKKRNIKTVKCVCCQERTSVADAECFDTLGLMCPECYEHNAGLSVMDTMAELFPNHGADFY